MSDRRVYFFLGAAVVCAGIYPVTPDEYKWVSASLAITYLVFTVMFAVASVIAERGARRRQPPGLNRPR